MAELLVRKTLNQTLEPDDDIGRAYLQSIKAGDLYMVTIKKPRNVQFLRKYMALIRIAWENQDKYDSFEAVRAEVIMRAGFFEEHHHLTGQVSYKAKSISFGNMEEVEFSDLYSKSIDIILKYFMPDSDPVELQNAVDEVLGFT